MRLIKSSFEIKEQELGLSGIYKQIEWAGRHCYQSLDKITEDSYKEFASRMIKSGHRSVLEHGSVYLKLPYEVFDNVRLGDPFKDPYSPHWVKYFIDYNNDIVYVSTNYRWIVENCKEEWLDKYLCEPTNYHYKRVTVKFILPISISREFCRHRVFSYSEMSTRYCNFSRDKFGKEITFIAPSWMDNTSFENVDNYLHGREFDMSFGSINLVDALSQCELSYLSMINKGLKPQQAREVLPLCTKTELVMTGFADDWEGFFELRTAESAHPQARELAIPLQEEFKLRKYIR